MSRRIPRKCDSEIYFGKYKGRLVSEVPLDYLQWLFDNVKLKGSMRHAVYYRLGRRLKESERRDVDFAQNGIRYWYSRDPLELPTDIDVGGAEEECPFEVGLDLISEEYQAICGTESYEKVRTNRGTV